jgi:hypothetical protein
MSTIPELLADTLGDDARPRLAGESIWSLLPEDAEETEWDSIDPNRTSRRGLHRRCASRAAKCRLRSADGGARPDSTTLTFAQEC